MQVPQPQSWEGLVSPGPHGCCAYGLYCPSVCLSVCHIVPRFQQKQTYDHAVFCFHQKILVSAQQWMSRNYAKFYAVGCETSNRWENCEFANISRYISETVQASAKVTIERKYEVICDLTNGAFQMT